MTLEVLDKLINNKMASDDEFIVFTFYELRVKYNLPEEETEIALQLAKQKLENNNYKVYLTGQTYIYKEKEAKVQDNQLLVALKI